MQALVFDSAPLSAFARSANLTLLERLTASKDRVTTQAVMDELADGIQDHPELEHVRGLYWVHLDCPGAFNGTLLELLES